MSTYDLCTICGDEITDEPHSDADGADIHEACCMLSGPCSLDPEHQTWTTDQLREDFEVLGFQAPFVVVKRRTDGVRGSLLFDHAPRVYYAWQEDS